MKMSRLKNTFILHSWTFLIFQASFCTPAYEFAVPKPEFGETSRDLNVTSFTGHTTRLPCTVRHLAGKQVSWIRGRDLTVLSSGRITFASDVRISVLPGTHGAMKRLKRNSSHRDESQLFIEGQGAKRWQTEAPTNVHKNTNVISSEDTPGSRTEHDQPFDQSGREESSYLRGGEIVEPSVDGDTETHASHQHKIDVKSDNFPVVKELYLKQNRYGRSADSTRVYHKGRYEKSNYQSYTDYGFLNYYGPGYSNVHPSSSSYGDKINIKSSINHEENYLKDDTYTGSSRTIGDLTENNFSRDHQFDVLSFNQLIENSNAKIRGGRKTSHRSSLSKSPQGMNTHVSTLSKEVGNQERYNWQQDDAKVINKGGSLRSVPSSSLSLSSPSLSSASSLLPPNYLDGVWEPEDYTLQIKFTEPGDAGVYICQVNTEPKTAQRIHLTVIDMVAKILGPKELFVKAGTPVTLVCQVDHSASLPGFIFWYKGDRLVDYEASNGRIQVLMSGEGRSDLVLKEAEQFDSSNYTCGPSGGQSASVMLNVIVDERPAAMQQGNDGSTASINKLGLLFSLLALALSTKIVKWASLAQPVPCVKVKFPPESADGHTEKHPTYSNNDKILPEQGERSLRCFIMEVSLKYFRDLKPYSSKCFSMNDVSTIILASGIMIPWKFFPVRYFIENKAFDQFNDERNDTDVRKCKR